MSRYARKKSIPALAVLLAAALSLGGLVACGGGGAGGEGGGGDAAMIAQGEKHFMSTCATCHGRDAQGLPNLGKGLHANGFVQTSSDRELIAFLKTGRPASHPLNTTGVDMPPKGGNPALSDEDMAAIVAYIKTLQ